MVPPCDPAAEAVFRPVRAGNALEVTVERLLCAIRLGVVPAGERFPAERDLAVRFGIGRITLREAIRHLQRQGYVESRRGRRGGTFVAKMPPRPTPDEALRDLAESGTDLEGLLAYRRGLETGAVVLLAEAGLTAEQALLLERRLTEAEAAGAGDYRRCDTVLHITLARMTGSPQMATALADARMRVNRLMDTVPPNEDGIADSDGQHRAIAHAVAERDPEAARRALGGHLSMVEGRLRSLLG